MKVRLQWLSCLGIAAAWATGCSSSSSGSPANPSDGGGQAVTTDNDATTTAQQDAAAIVDAPAAPVCDAVSLATIDAGATACFACQTAKCAPEITACSTDCSCAPAYNCLQANSAGGINSGYSACPSAIDALMNGDPGLMNLASCATTNCNPQCFGGSADGG
jgi:hypothetical protein